MTAKPHYAAIAAVFLSFSVTAPSRLQATGIDQLTVAGSGAHTPTTGSSYQELPFEFFLNADLPNTLAQRENKGIGDLGSLAVATAESSTFAHDAEGVEWTAVPRDTDSRVLILDLEANGVDQSIVWQAGNGIPAAFLGETKIRVVTFRELQKVGAVEKTKIATGCKADAACLSELGRWADADYVISGAVGKVGRQFVVNLSLVKGSKTAVVSRVSGTVEKVEQIGELSWSLTRELLGWAKEAASAPRFRLAGDQKISFAVFDLEASGVAPELAASLTRVLAFEIKRIDGTIVIGRDDVMALIQLEKEKTMLGCASNVECLAEIGAALGVDKLVVGQVAKLGDKSVVSLRLLDTRKIVVESIAQETFSGSEELFLGAIRLAGRRLLGIEEIGAGRLVVTASESGALVTIDENSFGKIPLAPIERLRSGHHRLRIVKNGYYDFNSDIYINPGETTVQWAPLERKPRFFTIPKWVFWTMLASTGAFSISWAGLGIGTLLAQQDYRDYAGQGSERAIDGSILMQKASAAQGLALGTNFAAISTIVVGMVTGAAAVFVDWSE